MTPGQRDEKVAGERADLEQADRHILEAEGRIEGQEALVDGLIADGHDAGPAEAILKTFHETLAAFHDHRALIMAELERLAAIPIGPACRGRGGQVHPSGDGAADRTDGPPLGGVARSDEPVPRSSKRPDWHEFLAHLF